MLLGDREDLWYPDLFEDREVLASALLYQAFEERHVGRAARRQLPLVHKRSLSPRCLLRLIDVVFLRRACQRVTFHVQFFEANAPARSEDFHVSDVRRHRRWLHKDTLFFHDDYIVIMHLHFFLRFTVLLQV